MAIQITKSKWSQEHSHGRTFFEIKEDGLHVQDITDKGDGSCVCHDQKVIPFELVRDFTEGQIRLV